MEIKHNLASKKDKKATILDSEMKKLKVSSDTQEIVLTYLDLFSIFGENIQVSYHKSRDGKTWYGNQTLPIEVMPKISKPLYHDVEVVKVELKQVCEEIIEKNNFDLIREWAQEKGIYDKGDAKTQYLKLIEEIGELSKSILKKDKEEFIDAIGDCVVVLTNLAHLGNKYFEDKNISIESCIESAYNVIAKRKGKMINGTFVKES